MKKILSLILSLALIGVTTAPTVGCSSQQVVAEVNTVLTEATNILVVAEPGAPWVPQLQAAVTALKAAEAGWAAGGKVQVVIDALNTIEAITAVIPLTAAYSPLIDVLVAGIESVLVALVPTTPQVVALKVARNPHVGRVRLVHHTFHSRSTEFKATWNDAAKQNGLVGAVIQ